MNAGIAIAVLCCLIGSFILNEWVGELEERIVILEKTISEVKKC